jgi:hypothetical protein
MDASNSQTSFVELTFAVNVIFAQSGYPALRIDDRLSSLMLSAADSKEGRVLVRFASQHLRVERFVQAVTRFLTFFCAATAVAILYLDYVAALGRWSGLLFLPYAVYFCVSGFNFTLLLLRLRLFSKFHFSIPGGWPSN